MILKAKVKQAFFKTNATKMTKFTQMYLEQHVRPNLELRTGAGSIEDQAKRALLRAFQQELAAGQITMHNVNLAAFLIAGQVDEHDLIPGLLSAHYLARRGNYWRRGSGSKQTNAQTNLAITRAAVYLSSRLRNKTRTLQALKLFYTNTDVLVDELAPVPFRGAMLYLPRPFQAINFEDSQVENFKLADRIIRRCHGVSDDALCPEYMIFDGTYCTRALDVGPPGTTHDKQVRCVGVGCAFKGADDPSTMLYTAISSHLKDAIRNATRVGAADLVSNEVLASELFEIFVHSASHRYFKHINLIIIISS